MARVTFRLEGDKDDDRLVRAPDLSEFLAGLVDALAALEVIVPGPGSVVARVADLKVGSAVLEVDVEVPSDADASRDAVIVELLLNEIAWASGSKAAAPTSEPRLRRAVRRMLRPLQEHVHEIIVTSDGTEIRAQHIPEEAPEPKVVEVATGSFTGRVDVINVHDRRLFYIYPAAGPVRVRCEFEPALLENLREAIGRYVTVTGTLAYQEGSVFPSKVIVDRLTVHPPREKLPTLASLFGAFPDLTGGLDSVTYIRQLRDAQEA